MCQHADQPAGFKRWIDLRPAYDCIARQPCAHGSARCLPGSGGSHGRHSSDMTWYLQGEIGIVQFKVFTGWMLDETPEKAWGHSMAADLGYHSPVPTYEGHEEYGRMKCDLLPAGECFYDGSGLNAEVPWRLLREHGSDAVWEHLEGYYASVFSNVRLPA